ncbi:patatin-like phospholipase family protein [Nitrospirillum iridis]|uniref:NTE family protein n=1 Tax=Nitrospirillum iridis TaxID=765888 RepID=A0A7X0ECW1_9PROT|nr:patatin-like phospholipase family protein [Nitrospirillum iridis]MBB6252088.1 NTE family protein [Nitrospirillum iridis]
MPDTALLKTHRASARPPFQRIALVLQGGGALGSYQAGAYEALAEADLHPDWVAGMSIGAINAALIAGNRPEDRITRLRSFWDEVTGAPQPPGWVERLMSSGMDGEIQRTLLNHLSAVTATMAGVSGMCAPRPIPPWASLPGGAWATSFYDTTPLRRTLERLVDFDRINAGPMRFSVGAVNVETGNFVYFDTRTHTIGPEHVMASAALPPGFPAVEVEGEFYWDGGLVSNTPLQWVLEGDVHEDTLTFQVDLWNARGDLPTDLAEAVTRQKEIQYSSRTRAVTDEFRRKQRLRYAIAALLDDLPAPARDLPAAHRLAAEADHKVFNIIHLIYHAKHHQGSTKDFEFSRLNIGEHWAAGYQDTVRTLRHPEVIRRPDSLDGVFTFDVAVDGRE